MYYELRVGIEEERTDKQIQKASCPPESERQGKNFCYKKGCQLKSKKFCTNWAHRFSSPNEDAIYVIIRATRRSSFLQGRGSAFIPRLF